MVKIGLWAFIVVLVFCIILIVAGPFIQIWAVNTLFKTTIEYSWLNWFCAIVLNSSISAVSLRNIK